MSIKVVLLPGGSTQTEIRYPLVKKDFSRLNLKKLYRDPSTGESFYVSKSIKKKSNTKKENRGVK